MVAGGVVLAAILASGGWWMLHNKASAPTLSAVAPTASRAAAYSPEDRRLSTIVLPFENASGDPAQDGIAVDMTRDVIKRLAQNRYIPVIPAATSASYRGRPLDFRKIGRDHDVHFVLTGDTRRENGRLIVSAALYETDDDRAIWSQQFDRPDRNEEWNSIVQQISADVGQARTDAEVARAQRQHPNNLDKRDLLLASQATALSPDTQQNTLAKIALVERALAIDPDYILSLESKAQLYAALVSLGFSADRDADLATAMRAADRALQLAPNDDNTLIRKAFVLHVQCNLDEAAALIRKVLDRDPLNGWQHRELGLIQIKQGLYKEALENFINARQLIAETNPYVDLALAYGFLVNDRFSEAIAQARLSIGEWPPEGGRGAEIPWLVLIAAESENRQTAEARADLQKFLATPRTYHNLADVAKLPVRYAASPKLLEGLRHAGMPEE
jgi:TolB-like protein